MDEIYFLKEGVGLHGTHAKLADRTNDQLGTLEKENKASCKAMPFLETLSLSTSFAKNELKEE